MSEDVKSKIALKVIVKVLFVYLAFAGNVSAQAIDRKIFSPNGNLLFSFTQKVKEDGEKQMFYTVSYKTKPVVLESKIDIQLDNHISQLALALATDKSKTWQGDLVLKSELTTNHDSLWNPLFGERNQIKDNYNQLVLQFEKAADTRYKMNLIIRVYNEGIAFRYYFPDNPTGVYYKITEEKTEFVFPDNTNAWYEQWAQAPIKLLPLQNWTDECERPLTLKLQNNLYACLTEAAMVDYVRTKFSLEKNKLNTIVTSLYESVDLVPYFSTPWRVIMVAEKPTELIQNNDIILNLNAPQKLKNTDWVKPGKIMRDMTLTNEGAKACIDFAADHHLQYILFDWKWYGPAFTFDSDASKVAIDLDLQNIIKYGEKKGIGVWLYVNQQALLKQDHQIFPIYKSWGVKGVKYGFVQVGSHRWTTWLHQSIQKAADNELMVNIHDEFRPTGEQRTWPNILTTEGIRGNEEMPDATHNTILPFTRGITGPGDYTICYYTDRIKTTHGHQLALGVINYSPLQTLFWYDKPADYKGEQEIEFFEKLPTVWDDTKVLQGEPGEYIITARKKGEEWFVGGITNNSAREVTIPLDFLPKKQKFYISIYSDDPSSTSRTKVKIEEWKLKSTDVLKLKLQPSGGIALYIAPEVQQEAKETARKNKD